MKWAPAWPVDDDDDDDSSAEKDHLHRLLLPHEAIMTQVMCTATGRTWVWGSGWQVGGWVGQRAGGLGGWGKKGLQLQPWKLIMHETQ